MDIVDQMAADLIDRLNNVKTDANDYFVIVEAVNAITTLRTKLKEMSEDICLQRDDAWDEGFACGYSRGEDEGLKRGYSNGYDAAYAMGYSEGLKETLYDGMPRREEE